MISLILALVVIGVLLYLLNTYVPMAAPIKTIINILVVVAVILWLLHALGFGAGWHFGRLPG
jgi:predicted membrane protein